MFFPVLIFLYFDLIFANSAICTFQENGFVTFEQNPNGSLDIKGTISGLETGKHGFHIHEKGDLSQDCKATGGHFNPLKQKHGGPNSAERHLGNFAS